uniref:Uncharacterized protein n=1 Tax=Ditylenchus dipsaci TaxID=166011 RepID=A0A915CX45_9BILA
MHMQKTKKAEKKEEFPVSPIGEQQHPPTQRLVLVVVLLVVVSIGAGAQILRHTHQTKLRSCSQTPASDCFPFFAFPPSIEWMGI